MQHALFLLSAVLLLAIGVVQSLAPTSSNPRNAQSNNHQPVPVISERSPSLDDIVPLSPSCQDEQDASRRLFMTSLIGLGLMTVVDVEPAKAVEVPQKNDDNPSSLSSTTLMTGDAATTTTAAAAVDWKDIFQKASKRALGGGKAGASAAVVQVFSLMWLRTSMNYQYRYGGNLGSSLKTLWAEGGIPRLYQGLPFALVQGPMTRFGDTAANVGILALLDASPVTAVLPLPLKTACGSIAAGAWRIVLMPIDTSKTAMQVEGADGLKNLWNDVLLKTKSPGPLYRGALAQAAATAVGHFPWFLTYNFLNEQIPEISKGDDLLLFLARSALLGLSASCVSDICSNSLRVIKTTKQTANLGGSKDDGDDGGDKKELSYPEIVALILETDGIAGLLGRGLQTRLLTNAIQGSVFSVLWKYFQTQGS